MTLPTGCRRSRDCCSLYNRRSIDSFDDESSRNSGGVGAGSTVSTLHNEKCIVSNPSGLRRQDRDFVLELAGGAVIRREGLQH